MDTLRDRVLRALGWKETPKGYWEDENHQLVATAHTIPSDAELIGLLLLELDRLTSGEFSVSGSYSGLQYPTVSIHSGVRKFQGTTVLEALVLAVEAAREGK